MPVKLLECQKSSKPTCLISLMRCNDHYPHGGKKKGSRESHLLIQPRKSRRPSQRMRCLSRFYFSRWKNMEGAWTSRVHDMFQGWEYGMPELRLGGRRGLHGGTEQKDHSQVSGLSTLGGWHARDWRGIGRIKGRCQGVKGGSGHADCVCLEDHVFLAADRSLGCQLQGGEGSWEQTRSERRCKATNRDPTCRGHLGLALQDRGCEVQRGHPQTCLFRRCPAGHDVVLCQGVLSPSLPPLQPGQQGATAQGHKLIFLLPLTLLSFCSLSFLVAARGVCVCMCVCAAQSMSLTRFLGNRSGCRMKCQLQPHITELGRLRWALRAPWRRERVAHAAAGDKPACCPYPQGGELTHA